MTTLVIVIWIAAVAARLILIDQPYIDHWSWRQSDVAAIARNFLQNGFRFAYPQVNWAGNAPAYVGTEFPILPFIAAVCYKFAGVHEWIGRIQAVILFAISLPFFFLLVREIFGSTAAVWAIFFYSFTPLNLFAGRSFMPDVPSLSLAIVGLYFFLRWVQHSESWSFFAAVIAISLSLLLKITSIVIAAPLLYILVVGRLCQTPGISQNGAGGSRVTWTGRSPDRANGRERVKRPTILGAIVFGAIALLPSAIWYWHAHQIAQQFYPHHFFGAGGMRIEPFSWYWQIARQTFVSSLTPVLAVIALVGLVLPQSRPGRYSRLFHWWLAAMIVFIIVVGYGNRHRWYQLPLVPIVAAFAGAACAFVGSRISSRLVVITSSIALAFAFLILAFVYVRPFYESSAAQLRDAGFELKKVTLPNALIVAADMGDPTIFYYAERKGWHFPENDAIYNGTPDDSDQAIENLERLRRNGATHFVFTRNTFWWLHSYPEFVGNLSTHATVIEATPEFRIYELAAMAR
ncbi:MAG: ArnT family glycosyltransferase [Candidatus Udaeobacter sp.]